MYFFIQPITRWDCHFFEFNSCSVQPFRRVKLLITAGSHPAQATVSTNFLIVDSLSAYNTINGWLTLSALWEVAFTYHLALKFPKRAGKGVVHRNQVEARRNYASTLKGQTNIRQETNTIDNFSFAGFPLAKERGNSLHYSSAPSISPSLKVTVLVEANLAK